MRLQLLTGSAHPALAAAVAHGLGISVAACLTEAFPDGEQHVRLCESPRGQDVYIFQSLCPPADAHLIQLLLLADAAHRAGADRITAVVPYLAYARQDRRGAREPVGARVLADMLDGSAIERLITVDLHTPAIEGFFAMPMLALSAISALANEVKRQLPANAVLVAPDLGAAKLVERFARDVDAPVAIVHKTRLSGSEVRVTHVSGEVAYRAPVIVDDMITTGGTIAGAVHALLDAGCLPEVTVVATHGLFVGPAIERLRPLPIRRIVVTDSVPLPPSPPLRMDAVTIGPLLADAIGRLNTETPLDELMASS
jgi:ribose-phosphate pyrophosphokinase